MNLNRLFFIQIQVQTLPRSMQQMGKQKLVLYAEQPMENHKGTTWWKVPIE